MVFTHDGELGCRMLNVEFQDLEVLLFMIVGGRPTVTSRVRGDGRESLVRTL